MSDEVKIILWALLGTAGIVFVLSLEGCTVSGPLHHRQLAISKTSEYDAGGWVRRIEEKPDTEAVALLVGGIVSLATGSPWPAVAGVGSKGLVAVGDGIGRVVSAPAQVLDNLTTTSAEAR